MFCSINNLNEKVFTSQILLFIFKTLALHIGEPSDCAVCFPSSGENLALMYFLSSMYVEDKKNQPRNKTA